MNCHDQVNSRLHLIEHVVITTTSAIGGFLIGCYGSSLIKNPTPLQSGVAYIAISMPSFMFIDYCLQNIYRRGRSAVAKMLPRNEAKPIRIVE